MEKKIGLAGKIISVMLLAIFVMSIAFFFYKTEHERALQNMEMAAPPINKTGILSQPSNIATTVLITILVLFLISLVIRRLIKKSYKPRA